MFARFELCKKLNNNCCVLLVPFIIEIISKNRTSNLAHPLINILECNGGDGMKKLGEIK